MSEVAQSPLCWFVWDWFTIRLPTVTQHCFTISTLHHQVCHPSERCLTTRLGFLHSWLDVKIPRSLTRIGLCVQALCTNSKFLPEPGRHAACERRQPWERPPLVRSPWCSFRVLEEEGKQEKYLKCMNKNKIWKGITDKWSFGRIYKLWPA